MQAFSRHEGAQKARSTQNMGFQAQILKNQLATHININEIGTVIFWQHMELKTSTASLFRVSAISSSNSTIQ